MIVATHRVVGVLEWPAESEPTGEMLTTLPDEVLNCQERAGSTVLSLRLPIAGRSQPAVVSADVTQLRRDLYQLFEEFKQQ